MIAHSRSRAHGSIALLCLLAAPSATTIASPLPTLDDQPILVIGASFGDGRLPFDDDLQAPFGGSSVGFGSYLSVGDALVRKGSFVINEAQAGATSFDRDFCVADSCFPVGWQGYPTQLQKAAARVAIPDPANATLVAGYNAKYVYVSIANDCMHSGAAGVPQLASSPCTAAEIDQFVDRMIDVGEDAIEMGLVPIYPKYPAFGSIDLSLQAAATGLVWTIDEVHWNLLADTYETRIADELPGAILVDAWKNYEAGPDGLHPTPKAASKAAKRIRQAIAEHEQGCG